jgi:UDP-N-acetylmuramoyl-L-alanyl-D-glutamate--2,6-diaminopimelate ligase
MKQIFRFAKQLMGKNITRVVRPIFHGFKGFVASNIQGNPAKKLKVIGITGTKGKTTTTTITGRLANLAGIKTGYISTAVIYTGSSEGEFLNPYKMTSIDTVSMQKYLKEMVDNGCEAVVLEMSSQGLEQNRHVGIGGFDITVFLNIYPEHLEAHGGWEGYVKSKSLLFKNIRKNGIFIGNEDFSETELMYGSIPDSIENEVTKILFSANAVHSAQKDESLFKSLVLGDRLFETSFTAQFDIVNCFVSLLIVSQLTSLGKHTQEETISHLASLLIDIKGVPGRMEWVVKDGRIVDGSSPLLHQLPNTSILVDYAHEPASMEQLLGQLDQWKKDGHFQTIIHIISCDGAGRDDWKKPQLGSISGKYADYSILTTDNYDAQDNPQDIVDLMAKDLDKTELHKTYFSIINRSHAMEKALEIASQLATPTLIVSTGVGSEQGLTQPHGTMKWDERDKWRELFNNFSFDNIS